MPHGVPAIYRLILVNPFGLRVLLVPMGRQSFGFVDRGPLHLFRTPLPRSSSRLPSSRPVARSKRHSCS